MSPGKDETGACRYITWQSSAPGALSTLMTSVVLYLLTRATLMSPGKDETCVCGYMYVIYIYPHTCVSSFPRLISVARVNE